MSKTINCKDIYLNFYLILLHSIPSLFSSMASSLDSYRNHSHYFLSSTSLVKNFPSKTFLVNFLCFLKTLHLLNNFPVGFSFSQSLQLQVVKRLKEFSPILLSVFVQLSCQSYSETHYLHPSITDLFPTLLNITTTVSSLSRVHVHLVVK